MTGRVQLQLADCLIHMWECGPLRSAFEKDMMKEPADVWNDDGS